MMLLAMITFMCSQSVFKADVRFCVSNVQQCVTEEIKAYENQGPLVETFDYCFCKSGVEEACTFNKR